MSSVNIINYKLKIKMKMKRYLLLIGLCFLTLFRVNAASDVPTRTEKKSFSGISEVKFEHSYGNMIVNESDAKQVELEIRYFDGKKHKSTCELSSTNGILFIKTVNPSNRGNDNCRIDYIISVPRKTNLNVDLKYGNIKMSDFSGNFKAQLAYSDLKGETLSCSNPVISCKYGDISLDKVENLSINTQYSDVKIKNSKTLNVDNRYSDYKIGQIGRIQEGSVTAYGDFKLDAADEVNLKLQYSNLTVGMLGKSLKTTCSYSDVVVRGSSKQLENINIQGSFSDVTLSLDPDLSANLDIQLLYGGFDIASKYDAKFTLSEKNNNKLVKKGTIGGKPTASIVISDTYANVKIK
ncbi:hypothetical protein FACS1894145_3910 [Bacteroidia bacterium]|nr:hypothetical protein FACS1894145_3910 [Bacteroidia bacterium]